MIVVAIACLIALRCVLPTPSATWMLTDAKPGKSLSIPGWLVPLVALGVCVVVLNPRVLVGVVPAGVVMLTMRWITRKVHATRRITRARAETARICTALSAQLQVGDIAEVALRRVAADHRMLDEVVATSQIGGSVPDALRELGTRPGCEGFASMGRAWALSQATGAPLASAVQTVADGVREQRGVERTVDAELASAKASGQLMAALPLAGVFMGFTTGGNPLRFLATTLVGQLCLGAAVMLVCLGLVWTMSVGGKASKGAA